MDVSSLLHEDQAIIITRSSPKARQKLKAELLPQTTLGVKTEIVQSQQERPLADIQKTGAHMGDQQLGDHATDFTKSAGPSLEKRDAMEPRNQESDVLCTFVDEIEGPLSCDQGHGFEFVDETKPTNWRAEGHLPKKRKRKPEYMVHTDGHNWRKYGQKVIVASDCPKQRYYYRCSTSGCPAKKSMQWSIASADKSDMVCTFSGTHNHSVAHPHQPSFDMQIKTAGTEEGTMKSIGVHIGIELTVEKVDPRTISQLAC